MNKVVLQFWELSFSDNSVVEDGCSIHLSDEDKNDYIKSIYKNRDVYDIPDSYTKIIGESVDAFIEDCLYEKLKETKSLKIEQYQFNNLFNMDEIFIKK